MAQVNRAADVALPVSDTPSLMGDGAGGGVVNSVSLEDFENIRLVLDGVEGKTIEIPLKGYLQILKNCGSPPQAAASGNAEPGRATERDTTQSVDKTAYWDIMRGWLLTVATLFVGMAFQAATQPPAWIPKPKDWFDMLFGKRAAGDITKKQAVTALLYLFFNTATFSMALMMVVLLLVMRHKSSVGRKKLLAFTRGFGVCLAISVSCNFTIGISDDGRIAALVCSIMAVYVIGVLFLWIKGYIRN